MALGLVRKLVHQKKGVVSPTGIVRTSGSAFPCTVGKIECLDPKT